MDKRFLAFIAVILALGILPFAMDSSTTFVAMVMAKSLAVLGILILLRADQVSFGHAMFFAIGAYAAAFLSTSFRGIDLSLLILAALVASLLAGLIVGVFVTRYRGIFFGMINLAFSMVFYSILEKAFHITGGSDGMRIRRPTFLGMEFKRAEFDLVIYFVILALAALCFFLVWRYLRSPLGQALRAIKTNETRLEYLGLSAKAVLLTGYVISAVLCGLGGVLMGIVQGLATPEHAFWTRSSEFVFIAVLGGPGHVAGALSGTFIFELIRTYAASLLTDSWQLILGVTLIIIILWAPGGIVELWNRAFNRKRAKSEGSVTATTSSEANQ
ncbi:branched-chain amino acid ABC transporter permease [Brucella thiophenivorans]|uniref:Branched-chain amino acid transport system / permease component family protein n=1 Tax=Brucella thiophenivorans TaxID=571255 RepID=A0A256FEX6_9HYPH|nr:branched-chain amino acid ABC transporter permease [Brucella thiophenivorans]OYR13394.1 branched-chain amino acid transport system / permease component family protein [Brucella thiophenivorans]